MSKLFNLKKGDKVVVAIEPSSNASRGVNMSLSNINEWTYEGEVVTVSKKYITVKFLVSNSMKFVIEDNFRNKYVCGGADYILYPSLEDIYNKLKGEKLYITIKNKFSSYENKYDLKTLEKILELLENDNKTFDK